MSELATFNDAMAVILKADPKAVKQAMEAEKQANACIREVSESRKIIGMTRQTKSYLDLSDIMEIRFSCSYCHSSMTVPVRAFDRGMPSVCPNCREIWFDSHMQEKRGVIHPIVEFANAFKVLERAMNKEKGFSVSLEIKEAETSSLALPAKD